MWLTALAARLEGHELQMAEVRIAITRVVQWGGELTRSNKLGTKNGQVGVAWALTLGLTLLALALEH